MTTKKKPAASRKKKTQIYRSFRLTKRIKTEAEVPPARVLLLDTFRFIKKHWRIFGLIVAVYGLLYIVFVQGFGGAAFNLRELKDALSEFTKNGSALVTSLTIFGALLTSGATTPDQLSSLYQVILLITTSLAVIWTIRQLYDPTKKDTRLSLRDAFYKSMTPLVPFVLVVGTIALQFMPLAAGATIYSRLQASDLITTSIENSLWLLLFGLLALLSIYMACSSIMAIYIVTLPNMTPMGALRAARKLAFNRRLVIIRRVLVLPLLLLILSAVVLVPLILWLDFLVQPLFFVMSMSLIVIIHTYLYNLYRSLL